MCALPSPRTQRLLSDDLVEGTAISASFLCLLHCLALPLLLLALPAIAEAFVRSELFHIAVAALVVPAAVLAFTLGYRRHRALAPAMLGAAGVACVVIALAPALEDSLSADLLTAAGSLLLIAGHLINWRLRGSIA